MKDFHCVGSSKMTQHELNLTSECAQCGKAFLHTGEHVYKRTVGGRQLMYCSYTCFRVKAKEDEKKERERFERECEMLDRKREREEKYRELRKLTRGEQIVIRSKVDAEVRLEDAKKKITHYGNAYLRAEPRSAERAAARKGLTRWERKLAYIKTALADYEKQEQEATKCTLDAEAL